MHRALMNDMSYWRGYWVQFPAQSWFLSCAGCAAWVARLHASVLVFPGVTTQSRGAHISVSGRCLGLTVGPPDDGPGSRRVPTGLPLSVLLAVRQEYTQSLQIP